MHLKKILIDHEKYPVKDRYPFNLKVFQGTKEMEFHSPIILSYPEAQIFSFDSVPIEHRKDCLRKDRTLQDIQGFHDRSGEVFL